MNRYLIASLLAIAAASTSVAFADDITVEAHPFVGSLSRAQVQAQLQDYRSAGANPWATSYNQLASFRTATTREQVTAEFLQSRDEVSALTGEDSGAAWLAAQARQHAAPPVVAGGVILAR